MVIPLFVLEHLLVSLIQVEILNKRTDISATDVKCWNTYKEFAKYRCMKCGNNFLHINEQNLRQHQLNAPTARRSTCRYPGGAKKSQQPMEKREKKKEENREREKKKENRGGEENERKGGTEDKKELNKEKPKKEEELHKTLGKLLADLAETNATMEQLVSFMVNIKKIIELFKRK